MRFQPQLIPNLHFLLSAKKRKKVAYGGRNGGKSYSFADAVLARMLAKREVVTVCREFHTTIKDSVHRLIKERISFHGLDHLFNITDTEVKCLQTDSILSYKHLHNNVTEVKGLQGTTICWIFEAEALEKDSWDVLDPTIRLDDAELWIEFNPRFEDDFIYQRFIINQDEDSIVAKVNYIDNVNCPASMIKLAEECKRNRPEEYRYIWMGEPQGLGSRVYPMFDKSVHVKAFDMKELINRGAEFFMGQDPHTVYWPFCVWVARIPKGREEFDYWVYNEFPMKSTVGNQFYYQMRKTMSCNLTLKQRATMFRVLDSTIDETYPIEIAHRALDTRFAKASGAVSETLNTRGIIVEMSDPQNGGLLFETPPEGTIDSQRDRIRELLSYHRDVPVSAVNVPHLYVAPWCENTIVSLDNHRDDLTKNREDERYKDPVDALKIAMAVMAAYPHHYAGSKAMEEQQEFQYVNGLHSYSAGWMK